MKTSLDLADIMFRILNDSPVKNMINGSIRKYARPLNSDREDIIINTLPISNQRIQRALVNVNIHVPNLMLADGDAVDDTQPNTLRLSHLTRDVVDILKERWASDGDYLLEVESQNIFPDGTSHFSNIRVSFYSPN